MQEDNKEMKQGIKLGNKKTTETNCIQNKKRRNRRQNDTEREVERKRET